uniref:Glycoside hydrolase family 5 domain-containing protein n=1 Tax=Noccaea caerulescens TaxID=107243 RepID=A0A1J3FX97_NOCCA
MVILDNHISQPGWCCSDNDGNGFFGDKHLNPNLWIRGLKKMASMFANVSSNVVAVSLRNELRGPKQNIKDWYKYMQEGAEAVHSVNQNILVIVSGLNYATDLSFLKDRPFEVSFRRKLVFEIHWYGFWSSWKGENLNKICRRETENIMRMSGFLLEKGFPLFVSEFGIDQRGSNVNDNRFLSCFLALAADLDIDWAIWTVAGSYYLRGKTIGSDESYGVLDWNWSSIRNSTILQMISAIQSPFQGPGIMETHPKKIIFHPSTGLCIVRKSLFQLKLGSCDKPESWRVSSHRVLSLAEEQIFCLKAYEKGKSVKLRLFFFEFYCSKCKPLSESKMQLSSITKSGESGCLDVDSDSNNIVTKSCKCLEGNSTCDPKSQWFKLVTSTRSRFKPNPFLQISPYSKTLSLSV